MMNECSFDKISKLHNYLFDTMGLGDAYDKYAREDAVFGIYNDICSGKDIKQAFNDTFNAVYDCGINYDDFDKFYKKVFKDRNQENGNR